MNEKDMGGPGKLALILIGVLLLAWGIPIILEWMGVDVSKLLDSAGHPMDNPNGRWGR